MRTPQKDTEGLGSYSYNVGFLKVSRMLQGGFSVFGIFLVTPPELPKEAQNTLRQLSMTQTKHISNPGNTTSLNFILIGDFRAKPADWKYQWWGCTSWPMFTCSVKLDLLFPVLEMHVLPQDMEKCVKEELQTWAKQIEDGLCLINGKTMPDEQTFRAQIIILLVIKRDIIQGKVSKVNTIQLHFFLNLRISRGTLLHSDIIYKQCICALVSFFKFIKKKCTFIKLGKSVKNKFLFTMTAYTGQTRAMLGQLCPALWDLWASCDTAWIQTRVSVVTPLALRCSALDRCTTREPRVTQI
uniref:Protein odr-4 homolog n=1 Tax=Oncorhynchus kisutch TaxID=8019 RepID=A0A8C7LDH9_ONCKI